VADEALGESIWQLLAEEGDIWLHDACFGDIVVFLFLGIAVIVEALAFLVLTILGSFAFHSIRNLESSEIGDALVTTGNSVGSDVREDHVAFDFVFALDAGGGGERAVALNQLLGENASETLEIVDILSVVGEQFSFLLKKMNEGVGGSEFIAVWNDVFSDRVEVRRIFSEEVDVEDFLWIVEAKML